MEYERKTSGAEPPKERIRHFREFHASSEKRAAASGSALHGLRCAFLPVWYDAGRASGCPLHNLVPEWNDLGPIEAQLGAEPITA